MKKILFSALLIFQFSLVFAQFNLPNNGSTPTGTSTIAPKLRNFHNRVISEQLMIAESDESNIKNLASPSEVMRTHTFTDGLGRPIQQVTENISPSGKDMVQITDYDGLGRSNKKYLPFTTSATSTNRFVSDDLVKLRDFYLAPPAGVPQTAFPYAESLTENSPLHTVYEQGAQGETWQIGGLYTQKLLSRTNWTNEVKRYRVDVISKNLEAAGFYPAKTLVTAEGRDEHGNIVRSYTNAFGKPVLKRVLAELAGTDTTWADTYFVYDEVLRLCYVLSPEFNNTPVPSGISLTTHAQQWAFIYNYDTRGRKISEHVPGTEGVKEFVYDQRDRLILSRTQAQADKSEWTFYKHDALNRVVMVGTYQSGAGRLALQNAADLFWIDNTNAEVRMESFQPYYYTTEHTFPNKDFEVEEVYYFDHYNFEKKANCGFAFFPDTSSPYFPDAEEMPNTTEGKAVGARFVAGTMPWGDLRFRENFTFYDHKNRVRQTKETFLLDGAQGAHFNITTVRYLFSGIPEVTETKHDYGCYNTEMTILETPEYDDSFRPTAVHTSIERATSYSWGLKDLEIPVPQFVNNQMTYNELGQVIGKKQFSEDFTNFYQDINFAYNIRGWLTKINDAALSDPTDLFGMELFYESGFDINQYNGNISGVRWRSKSDHIERAYGYQYDRMNRILRADFAAKNAATGLWTDERTVTGTGADGNFSLYDLEYDLNGNILQMRRNGLHKYVAGGNLYGLVDDLQYRYEIPNPVAGSAPVVPRSNRLLFVDDAVVAPQDAPDFEDRGSIYVSGILAFEAEYAYDRSGNLTKDNNKKILNIKYNRNNQATEIEFEGDRKIINFRDGSGAVYKKEVWENGTMLRKTEYGGRFVYEGQNTNVPNYLSFVSMPEGRMAVDSLRKRLEPEFHYTDHLGNLRLAYRNAAPFYEVTAEPDRDAVEETYFATLDAFRTDARAHTGAHSLKVNSVTQPMYERIVIPVTAGEKLKLSVWGTGDCGSYGWKTGSEAHQQSPKPDNKKEDLSSFLAPALGFSQIETQAAEGKIQNQQLRFNLLSLLPLAKKLLGKKQKEAPTNKIITGPWASYILLRMRITHYPTSGGASTTWVVEERVHYVGDWKFLLRNIDIPSDGQIKISFEAEDNYLCNAIPDGFFDNFRVQRLSPVVFQENHYDPWGLNLKGIEENDAQTQQNVSENRLQSNAQSERETFFGLAWLETPNRPVDAQIGRMWGVDALADNFFFLSPMVFSGNNPILFADPSGLDFTETAWSWVKKLNEKMEKDIEDMDDNIRSLIRSLESVTDDKARNKINKKIAKAVEKRKEVNAKHDEVRAETATLAASSQMYNVNENFNEYNEEDKARPGNGSRTSGAVFNFDTEQFDINLPKGASVSDFAHELKHAYQFEIGDYSSGGVINIPRFRNFLYDKQDEIEAYQRGKLFGNKNTFTLSTLPKEYSSFEDTKVNVYNHPLTYMNLTNSSGHNAVLQKIANVYKHAFRVNGTTFKPIKR